MVAPALQTRQGEFLTIEADLGSQGLTPVGVLLYDPQHERLGIRFRRDWDGLVDPEHEEVFGLLAQHMEQDVLDRGASECLRHWEDTLSNTVRLSSRQPVLLGSFDTTLNLLYRQNVPSAIRPYRTHLPLYSCKAAAGRWSEQIEVEPEGWVEAPLRLRLAPEMFVARVTGHSMEPEIPDGSLCVFRAPGAGSRDGRRVLVENYGQAEAGGSRYTIKRYHSAKRLRGDGSWEHESIRLEPLNPAFESWELREGEQCRIIAEFVALLDA